MSSVIGNSLKISIFGESHGGGIGVVIDGLPAGEVIDSELIAAQLLRRAPGRDKTATPRRESDRPEIISGILNGRTTGAPLAAIIRNTNTRSADYSELYDIPRPNHADYPASVKYGGNNDLAGSGHFSGRLTAPLTFAGAVCRQLLSRRGVTVGGHILQIGGVCDSAFDPVGLTEAEVTSPGAKIIAVIDPSAEQRMRDEIESARMSRDSVGGIVEVAAVGLPAGIGDPIFDGLEGVLSKIVFGIPAVKGIEFGAGFGFGSMRGSRANDCYISDGGKIRTATNNCGGILGGISSGMPLIMRAALKPTPSVSRPQHTLNIKTMEMNDLEIRGRHDPCIVPRALPAIEAAVCVGLCDAMITGGMA